MFKENFENEVVNRAILTIGNSLNSIENSMYDLKAQFKPLIISTFNLYNLVNEVFYTCKAYVNNKRVEFINEIALTDDFPRYLNY